MYLTYEFRNFRIREDMVDAIQGYIRHGWHPGDFLSAVIGNDLKEAVTRADDDNLRNLPAFVAYFYNEAPAACWGSPEKQREWLARPEFAGPPVEQGKFRGGKV